MRAMYALCIMIATIAITTLSIYADTIPIVTNPTACYPGSVLSVVPTGTKLFTRTLLDVRLNNVSIREKHLVLATRKQIQITVPDNTAPGEATLQLEFDDKQYAMTTFIVTPYIPDEDTLANGRDPNPATNTGHSVPIGQTPRGKQPGPVVVHPTGGYGNADLPCTQLHVIDGVFTDSVATNIPEWEGITPQQGKFSNLYLDYCSDQHIMYLLNDWYLCTAEMDSNSCYNKFTLFTGNGSEHWEIWVYHSLLRGMKVIRNGVDVSSDTSFVLHGQFGFASSPLHDTAHTIYEFGIRVQSGLFFLPAQSDPYQPPVNPNKVETICDHNNIEGWGLVQEPTAYGGVLSDDSVTVRRYKRYLPLSGATGLVTEPFVFGGNMAADSITIYGSDSNSGTTTTVNHCSSQHSIDGRFSSSEWLGSTPAQGKYTNLYAQYCNGTLYILNDWKLATTEPHQQSCYNLFELYTGDGAEHWGIFVYNNKERGIKVFRNGVDVSNDSSIVKGGAYSWGVSPLVPDSAHTLYEFGITAAEGGWFLLLADPGPASNCDEVITPVQEQYSNIAVQLTDIRLFAVPPAYEEYLLQWTTTTPIRVGITIMDMSGRQLVHTYKHSQTGTWQYTISAATLSSGLYFVRLATDDESVVIPFVLYR